MVVLLAAFAIFFALVFPLAPTPRPLGKDSVALTLALVHALIAALALLAAGPAEALPTLPSPRAATLHDLTCVQLC